eukprot:931872-Rhodomonas_salina.1
MHGANSSLLFARMRTLTMNSQQSTEHAISFPHAAAATHQETQPLTCAKENDSFQPAGGGGGSSRSS